MSERTYTLTELARLTRRSVYSLSERAEQRGIRSTRRPGNRSGNRYTLAQVRLVLGTLPHPLSTRVPMVEHEEGLEGLDATGATHSPSPGTHQASAPGDNQARRNVR